MLTFNSNRRENMDLQINRNGVCVKFEDGYELGIHLHWGINSLSTYERMTIGGWKDGNNFEFVMRWNVDTVDGNGERNRYHESCRLPIGEYHGRDSYVGLLSEALSKVLVRAGRGDGDCAAYLVKTFSPYFDALEYRFSDMVTNISLVTQVFEQPIYIPETVYGGMVKEITWSPKGKKTSERDGGK
jgi:hypothetical protein